MKFENGDIAFVPSVKIIGLPEQTSAFYRGTVVEVQSRSIKVSLPNGDHSNWVGTGLCQKDVGILILSIGDDNSEMTLLDPLAKSVLQYCRLLVTDGYVKFHKIRSLAELRKVWLTYQQAYSCVILIGHGSNEGFWFFVDDLVTPAELVQTLQIDGAPAKTFISLACQTGFRSVAQPLSRMAICNHFLAPFESVHGAVASQFVQTFLANHFLVGSSSKVAFKAARKGVPGGVTFRMWKNGMLES